MRTYTRKRPQPQEIANLQELCRLCLGKTTQMTPIFGAESQDFFAALPMRIMMCLGLEVTKEDVFPKLLCQQCSTQLDRFYAFKKKCAATYRKLKASIIIIKKSDKNKINEESNEKPRDILFGGDSVKMETLNQNQKIKTEGAVSEAKELVTSELNSHQYADYNSESSVGVKESVVDYNFVSQVDSGLNSVQEEEYKRLQLNSKESVSTYLLTNLVEKGVLARRGSSLEILDNNIKTIKLETAYGSQVIMELVEEEPELQSTKVPMIFDTDGNNARCGECGGQFASRGALARHRRVHSGERPFACAACGRAFAQREVLRRHELLHADKLPYQCSECPKAYTQRGALQAHARAHAPPHARLLALNRCSRCPKAFLYPSGLSRHTKQVHEGCQYSCGECPRIFRDKSSLHRHARAHRRRAS